MLRLQPDQILGTLERRAVRYVIIGGLGATLHGASLVTRDTDICPARDAENLERLANRDKDRMALPTLRLLLQKIKERQGSSGS